MQSGGWWHNLSILSATGEGIEKEEPRAWEGNWNENVVELMSLTSSLRWVECHLNINFTVLSTGTKTKSRFSTPLRNRSKVCENISHLFQSDKLSHI